MGDLTEHFSAHEFRCHDGSEHSIDPDLLEMLEDIRQHFGAPVTVTSGYRSPAWNKRVGGASNSFHVKGMAADIRVKGYAPKEVYRWADKKFPVSGLGLYERPNGWVHVDCRPYTARWRG